MFYKKQCAVCPTVMDITIGRPPKYCSSACRQKAYRLRKALK